MEPFYFFSRLHNVYTCDTRPARSRWRAGSLPAGVPDGWSWSGRKTLRYYAYPTGRWLPPPLHRRYRPLPLPSLAAARTGARESKARARAAPRVGGVRRAYVSNKYYREGRGRADNFWALHELRTIFDTLLGCGFEVTYNHPTPTRWHAPDRNDLGGSGLSLGDFDMLRSRYPQALRDGRLAILSDWGNESGVGAVSAARGGGRERGGRAAGRRETAGLSFNELQLRAVSKARCFLAPQGGASYLTFYQPGFHVVNDRTGKERCAASTQAGGSGTYWHYYTQLAGDAGESVIYNVAGDGARLRNALAAMFEGPLCAEPLPTL